MLDRRDMRLPTHTWHYPCQPCMGGVIASIARFCSRLERCFLDFWRICRVHFRGNPIGSAPSVVLVEGILSREQASSSALHLFPITSTPPTYPKCSSGQYVARVMPSRREIEKFKKKVKTPPVPHHINPTLTPPQVFIRPLHTLLSHLQPRLLLPKSKRPKVPVFFHFSH